VSQNISDRFCAVGRTVLRVSCRIGPSAWRAPAGRLCWPCWGRLVACHAAFGAVWADGRRPWVGWAGLFTRNNCSELWEGQR